MGVVVPLDERREPAESLAPLLEIVNEDMNAINRIILDKAISDVDMIPELAHHPDRLGRQAASADAGDRGVEAVRV